MICEHCGNSNRAGASRCANCNAPLPSGRDGNGFYDIFRGEPPAPAQPNSSRPPEQPSPPSGTDPTRRGGSGRHLPPQRPRKLPLVLSAAALLLSGATLAVVLSIAARLPHEETALTPAFDTVPSDQQTVSSAYRESAAQAYLRGLYEGYERGAAKASLRIEEAVGRLRSEIRSLTSAADAETAPETPEDAEGSERTDSGETPAEGGTETEGGSTPPPVEAQQPEAPQTPQAPETPETPEAPLPETPAPGTDTQTPPVGIPEAGTVSESSPSSEP